VPWHKSKEHVAADLICLCAACHERADLEDWGERTLRDYKRRPWVLRQFNDVDGKPADATAMAQERFMFRRQLVASWRKMALDVVAERDKRERSLAEILERHESYYSLKPHLRPLTIGQITCPSIAIVGTTIDSGITYMLEDIASLEKDWCLT
jgi:hypothetical protein